MNKRLLFLIGLVWSFHFGWSQCVSGVSPNNSQISCFSAHSPVAWYNLSNMGASANTLTKNAGGNAWNSGAFGVQSVWSNGSLYSVVDANNRDEMLGLSSVDGGSGFASIQYAIYMRSNGRLEVYESNTFRGQFNTYVAGDTVRIAAEAGVIKYYLNSSLFYTSGVAPSFPLYPDASINQQTAQITNCWVVNPFSGSAIANVSAVTGTNTSYNWFRNGASSGNTSNFSFTPAVNDSFRCVVTVDSGACHGSVLNTPTVYVRNGNFIPVSKVAISTSSFANACLYSREPVYWTAISNTLDTTGFQLRKYTGNSAWDAGAFGTRPVSNNGKVVYYINGIAQDRMVGLSDVNVGNDFSTIDFAIYLRSNGRINIYESGSDRGQFGPAYVTGDSVAISVENNQVKYYYNQTLLYVSLVAPVLPMFPDVSLNTAGTAVVGRTFVYNGSRGNLVSQLTSCGASPVYSWTVNGVASGNLSSFSSSSLAPGNLIRLSVIPDAVGCTNPIWSEPVNFQAGTSDQLNGFFIESRKASSACYFAVEDVVWSGLVRMNQSGQTLTKIQDNNLWNGGGFSLNSVLNNGYLELTALETNQNRMIGLSATNPNADFASIQYSVYLKNNGFFNVYESGSDRGQFGSYVNGDVFRIAAEAGVIKYYKNGSLFYISAIVPSFPLYADFSVNTISGTVHNVKVANGCTGVIRANPGIAGTNPTYAWRQNGALIGSSADSVVLNVGTGPDTIVCTIYPDFPNCSAGFLSRNIIVTPAPSSSVGSFYIEAEKSNTACYVATEQVVWTDLTNNNSNANSLVKIQSTGVWNGGAASFNRVANNGYFFTVVAETNQERMVGLSNTNANSNFTSIQYAFYLRSNGLLNVYESGFDRGNVSTYATGDTLKIGVENSVVKYYKNSTLLYMSAVTPTLPLLVDVSINTQGGTIQDAWVANGTSTRFFARFPNAGNNPVYQWLLNGSIIGTNNDTISYSSFTPVDTLLCRVSPDLPGCQNRNPFVSAPIIINSAVNDNIGPFYIYAQGSGSACMRATQDVSWNSVVNLNVTGNSLTKIQSNNVWDGGAASNDTVFNGGYLTTRAAEVNRDRMIGLSSVNTNANFTSIQFAIFLRSNGLFNVYESGFDRGNFGSYVANDVFKIALDGGRIKYYKNDQLFYISAVTPASALVVDLSIEDVGGTVRDVKVTNGNNGVFKAIASGAGSSPTIQWYKNGVYTGVNAAQYSNQSLSAGDVITAVLTPDLPGCTGLVYYSDTIVMDTAAVEAFGTFYVFSEPAANACKYAIQHVTLTGLNNLNANGNSVVKIQSNNVWDGGASSLDTLYTSGILTTIAAETNRDRMVGLSASDVNSNYTSIQYAFYLRSNGLLNVYESGADRGNFGSYVTGDTLKIASENGRIYYYRNSTLLYISAVIPASKLVADISIEDIGGTVNQIKIQNGTQGTVRAVASNVGNNPVYQWYLNGLPVGTNSSVYNNPALGSNDSVWCELRPSLGGCSNSTYRSAMVLVNDAPVANVGTFLVVNTPSTPACLEARQQISWTSVLNLNVSGNNLIKIQSNGVWDGGAASRDTVYNMGYLQFTASETNRDRMVGLSATNPNSNFTSIQYAVYLRSNGLFNVYESGFDRGNFGSYVSGDVFKVANDNGVIKYYKNNNVFYISALVPSSALIADVSIEDIGGTVTNALVVNGSSGTFRVLSSGGGNNPTYQWKLNGNNVGSNSATFSAPVINNNDSIWVLYTPDLGGCNSVVYTSPKIFVSPVNSSYIGTFYATADSSTQACLNAVEFPVWTALNNLQATGKNLVKIQSNGIWDGGASTLNVVHNGGYMQHVAGERTTDRMVGLSAVNNGNSFNTIQYAFFLRSNGLLNIYESGTDRGNFGSYFTGDVLRISVENGVVRYMLNGNVLYATNAVTLPLVVDLSIEDIGGTVQELSIANGNIGRFLINATNAGANPVFNWLRNGQSLGINDDILTLPSVSAGDTIVGTLTPDFNGCQSVVLSSNPIILETRPFNTNTTFYIRNNWINNDCKGAIENVSWTNLTIAQTTANTLRKIQGGNAWNSGASSFNQVFNNGYLTTTITQTNTDRAIGLSASDANVNLTSIQYGFQLRSNGTYSVIESGTLRTGNLAYALNDVFRVSVVNNAIRYFRNNVLVYSSLIAPSLPLIADASIFTQGGVLSDVKVGNGSSSSFTAVYTNAGNNPAFEWYINGVNQGVNEVNFDATNASNGDTVYCRIIPDLGGCNANTATNSNLIVITEPFTIVGTTSTTTWNGSSSTSWNNAANWSAGVPDAKRSAVINSGAPRYPVISGNAAVLNLTLNGGASLTLSSTANLAIYGNVSLLGTLSANTASRIQFTSCSASNTITATGNVVFGRITVNNPSNVIWTGSLSIAQSLIFSNGNLVVSDSMVFLDNATVSGYSASSKIVGVVIKEGNEAFTFPIGTSDRLLPIGISATSGSADRFRAQLFTVPVSSNLDTTIRSATISGIYNSHYWTLDRTSGTASVYVSLGWDSLSGISDLASLAVIKQSTANNQWIDYGNSLVNGSLYTGMITSGDSINTFSPFALGRVNLALPIKLADFDAYRQGQEVFLNWLAASDQAGPYFFELLHSTDASQWNTLTNVPGIDNLNLNRYQYLHEFPEKGINYYQLRMTDVDGIITYSEVKAVEISDGLADLMVYPNPASDYLFLEGSSLTDGTQVQWYDLTGRELMVTKMQSVQGGYRIPLSELPRGTYLLKIQSGQVNQNRMITLR